MPGGARPAGGPGAVRGCLSGEVWGCLHPVSGGKGCSRPAPSLPWAGPCPRASRTPSGLTLTAPWLWPHHAGLETALPRGCRPAQAVDGVRGGWGVWPSPIQAHTSAHIHLGQKRGASCRPLWRVHFLILAAACGAVPVIIPAFPRRKPRLGEANSLPVATPLARRRARGPESGY